ncbi:type II toxin-antitoxin system VapC family toxin [Sinorhizobium meliloti]|uniref:type II toxin-antitoxin system VapC family toxin n=1 Tax=Rhizobium meliloti TaxID=382 RepID=UPI000FDC3A96|nr:hypothetical protein [Sinorhizobium meliloti]MDW9378336.1 hypothetical protein [Sinorhizobium meliloti]MDW9496683.1 hypothetical protein [Sinorhizobium meliloti]MDW9509008.1 hypothetical protein [Sinorhizobium meliloti]MDW9565268.1 hypothetical protein [Sinorhizobium meliloti]MDW9652654.1 hypothetical protein [Sinorhizobium meliloti]
MSGRGNTSAANDLTHLALLAFTTQPPEADRIALDVSDIECRRAGLSDRKRCWIVVDEYNYDVAERSWYIGPDDRLDITDAHLIALTALPLHHRDPFDLLMAQSVAEGAHFVFQDQNVAHYGIPFVTCSDPVVS